MVYKTIPRESVKLANKIYTAPVKKTHINLDLIYIHMIHMHYISL